MISEVAPLINLDSQSLLCPGYGQPAQSGFFFSFWITFLIPSTGASSILPLILGIVLGIEGTLI